VETGALNVPVERGAAAELKARRHLPPASPATGSGGHHTLPKEHIMSERSALVAKTLNYQQLRQMVESAASYRDETVYIVVDDEGWRVETMMPVVKPGAAVIPCESPGATTGRPPVLLAKIGTNEEKPANLLDLKDRTGKALGPADAVFWTPAAVEKFVVPYYASVYGDQAPKKLTDLIGILGVVRPDDDVVPLAPLSRPDSLPLAPLSPPDSPPFAVAHMPKSEYVQVDGGTDGGMVVLAADAEGNVSAMSVSDYVESVR
jgi:hypothetical protein